MQLHQDWLDRYELEPYMLFQALRLGYRVREVPVLVTYPQDGRAYTKMRAVVDWWRIFRPAVFLALNLRS
jgi:dolichol-phosphate mannosyltransferase